MNVAACDGCWNRDGSGGERLTLESDRRTFADRLDVYGTCRRCGCNLILLPDDRRQGFCFDCYDPSNLDDAAMLRKSALRIKPAMFHIGPTPAQRQPVMRA